MTGPIAVAGLDGAGNPITIRADQAVDNSVAFRSSLEVGGVPVGPANPVPSGLPAVASVFSTQLESAHVLKAGPGTLYAFEAYFSVAGFVMLFDAAAVPADGNVVPRKVWPVYAAQNNSIDKAFNPPLAMAVGVVLVFSSTGPFIKTALAQAQFSGEVA